MDSSLGLIAGTLTVGSFLPQVVRAWRTRQTRDLSLSMFAVAILAARRAGKRRPASLIRFGFGLYTLGIAILIPIIPRADSGWALVIPLIIAGVGLGLLVSQLNNYTLAPVSEERVSEAAGVNSAGGSFGLSFGLAFAGAIHIATDRPGR